MAILVRGAVNDGIAIEIAATAIAISSLALTSVQAKPHSSSIVRAQDNSHAVTGRVEFYNPDRVGFEMIGEFAINARSL